jgi:prolipoprotein diacylglyceryltransferase
MAWMPETIWREIAGVRIEYPALYVALSFWIALLLFSRKSIKEGGSADRGLDWVPFGIVGGLLGARLGYFAFEIPVQFMREPQGMLWHPGFSENGAMLGLLSGTALFARLQSLPVGKTFDQLALAGALGFLFTSIGGLLSSEMAGVVSEGGLVMSFPIYDEGNLHPPLRVPIFHMQCLWAAFTVGISWWIERSKWMRACPAGTMTCLVLLLVSVGHLALDPFKEQANHLAQSTYHVSFATVDAVMSLTALVGLTVLLRRTQRERLAQRTDESKKAAGLAG